MGTPLERLRKRRNRSEALMLVLDEQEQQYVEDGRIWDEVQISLAYREVSIECQIQAEKRALQDRKEIEQQQEDNATTDYSCQSKKDIVAATITTTPKNTV